MCIHVARVWITSPAIPLMTPIMRGWGMADLMCRDCAYSAFSFLLFFCSVYIWISSAYTCTQHMTYMYMYMYNVHTCTCTCIYTPTEWSVNTNLRYIIAAASKHQAVQHATLYTREIEFQTVGGRSCSIVHLHGLALTKTQHAFFWPTVSYCK